MTDVEKKGKIKWNDRWDLPAIVYVCELGNMCDLYCKHDCSICPMRMVDPRFEELVAEPEYKSYDVATKKGVCSGFAKIHPFKAVETVSDFSTNEEVRKSCLNK